MGDFLNEVKLWKLASHEDPYVRRALCRILVVALAKEKELLNPSMLTAQMLTSGLHTSQAGSAFDFAKAIAQLTIEMPDVWTVHYTGSGKKSAQNRLSQFLKRGSQGGPAEFWGQISIILETLSSQILVKATEEPREFDDDVDYSYSPVLDSIHDGLHSRDEPRANQGAAWDTYLHTAKLVMSYLPDASDRHQFYKYSVFPIVIHYVRPSPQHSQWAIAGPHQEDLCTKACKLALRGTFEVLDVEWLALSSRVVEDMKTSMPEQSKEFSKSQDAVSAEMSRWYRLQASLLDHHSADQIHSMVERSVSVEIPAIIAILEARNGKPYGAASALESLISTLPELVLSNNNTQAQLVDFANNILPNILLSPSAKHLIRLLGLLEGKIDVHHAYKKCMQTLIDAPDSSAKAIAMQSFLSSTRLSDTDSLSTEVLQSLSGAMDNDDISHWNLVMAAVTNPAAPKQLTEEILATMTAGLSISSNTTAALNGLEKIVKYNSRLVNDFVTSSKGSTLCSRLLLLSDSPNESISQRARVITNSLDRMLSINGGSNIQGTRSMIEMVNQGLEGANTESLPYVGNFPCCHYEY